MFLPWKTSGGQWCKYNIFWQGGILGERMMDPQGLVSWDVGRGYTFPSGEGSGKDSPLPRKNWTFTWNGVFWCILSGTFLFVSLPKNVEFSAWSDDLVDIEDLLLGNSVRIMGLLSFLLHYCIVMQAIWCLKFWNMTKSGGQLTLASPTSNPLVPRDLHPCWWTYAYIDQWVGLIL